MGKCVNCNKKNVDKSDTTAALEKLCGKCLSKLNRSFCVYCVRSFHVLTAEADLPSTQHKCIKCKDDEEVFGQPTDCSVCVLKCAFEVGKPCKRCTKNQSKYGEAVLCTGCDVTRAFGNGKKCYTCKLDDKKTSKEGGGGSAKKKKRKTTDTSSSSQKVAKKAKTADNSSSSSSSSSNGATIEISGVAEIVAQSTALQNKTLEMKAQADEAVKKFVDMLVASKSKIIDAEMAAKTYKAALDQAKTALITEAEKKVTLVEKLKAEKDSALRDLKEQTYEQANTIRDMRETIATLETQVSTLKGKKLASEATTTSKSSTRMITEED
jgi:hypothetical protein